LLTWLSDHDSDVFFVATSNDVSRLPPEFARAERFDALFFLDLPGRQQKDDVWAMYGHAFGVDVTNRPDDDRWTPAEIKACCRLAALLGVPVKEAAKHVVPVASTGAEQVAKLRQWASGRCLDAETGEVFRHQPPPQRRQTPRDPSNN
jgi:SpoVK/Ycf46/Vps4 family AAA+-type ATPase